MSQKTTNDTCTSCKKAWLTHHTLVNVSDDGKLSIHCHPQPVAKTDFVLKYVLEARAAKLEAQSALASFKKQVGLEKQASEAELQRKHDAKVEAAAEAKAEETRVELIATHEALTGDLKQQLRDAESTIAHLDAQRQTAVENCAKSAAKADELQSQIGDLSQQYAELRGRHKGLKDRSMDVIRGMISMCTRLTALEEKAGVTPKVDPKELFQTIMGEPYTDDISLSGLSVEQTPTLQTEVVTAPAAAPKAAPAPVQTTNVVVLYDDQPESEASASADDEDDGHDHEVGDADVEQEFDSPDEDDTSSEEGEHKECRVCDKHATKALTFTLKDGTEDQLETCDPNAHPEEFLSYLTENAKTAPKSAKAIAKLFTQSL